MKNLLLLTFTIFSCALLGQPWTEKVLAFSSDQQSDDNFGNAVAIDGNLAIVGAWHHDLNGAGADLKSNAGAAYIFVFDSASSTWVEEAKILAADREMGDAFGFSVDISGSYAVVGAVERDAARGAAFVYERSSGGTWTQVKKLEAPVQQASDRFGNAVAIDGDFIVVGAHHEDEDTANANTMMNAGSAYIYKRSAGVWDFYQKIVPNDRNLHNYFGWAVDIDDDKLIVGAYNADPDTPLVATGAAFVFENQAGDWTQIKELTPIDAKDGDRFGWAVAVYDDYFLVGAPYQNFDDSGSDEKLNAGAAYVFDGASSFAEFKLTHDDRIDQDNLGQDVAIYGTTVVVGASNQDYDLAGGQPYFANGGAAYVFDKMSGSSTWAQSQKLLAADRFTGDQNAYAVGISGKYILTGAVENNQDTGTVKPSVGSAYFFENTSGFSSREFKKGHFDIYPNPAKNVLILTFNQITNATMVEIYNMLGESIAVNAETNGDKMRIDISKIKAGTYFVRWTDGKNESTSKFIKVN